MTDPIAALVYKGAIIDDVDLRVRVLNHVVDYTWMSVMALSASGLEKLRMASYDENVFLPAVKVQPDSVQPDMVRMLRLVEYVGTREAVEAQVHRSLHGMRVGPGGVQIAAVTINEFPEVLSAAKGRPLGEPVASLVHTPTSAAMAADTKGEADV